MSLAIEFAARLRRVLRALQRGSTVAELYPQLRELEPLREAAFGPKAFPGLLVKVLPMGGFEIATSIPDRDQCIEGTLPENPTVEEAEEIRKHLIQVIECWIDWIEYQREIGDPVSMVIESLEWFRSLTPLELVERASGESHRGLLPLFRLNQPTGYFIADRGGFNELEPRPAAIDEAAELLLAGPINALGLEVARHWTEFSGDAHAWRVSVVEAVERWRWDACVLREIGPDDDLREILGDEVIEQAESLRAKAAAMIRLMEHARNKKSLSVDPAVAAGDAIQRDALRAVVDGGLAGVLRAAESVPSREKISNDMFTKLKSDSSYYEWNLGDWADSLKCAKQTIAGNKNKGIPPCDAWKHILGVRAENKEARKVDSVSDPVSKKTQK